MASNPPGQCCTVGVKHEGTPKGERRIVNDIPVYVSYPDSQDTSVGLVILPDIIGYDFVNTLLVADQFAANGYFVVLPDLFEGDPVPLREVDDNLANFDIMGWALKGGPQGKGHTPSQVDPIVEKTIAWMRDHGTKKIGAVGYCFGAKYVARFLAEGKGVAVGYMAHPSMVEEDEIKAITGPVSIAAAEHDEIYPAALRHKTEELLGGLGIPFQQCLYSGVHHGFATRCDLSKKGSRFAKEAAFLQAVHWLDEFMKE